MYIRSLIIFLFLAHILSATETLISPNNLLLININEALYQPKLHPDPRYNEYYMLVTLDPLNQDSTDYHNKISFWWCKTDLNSFYVTPYIYRKSQDFSLAEANKLDLSISKTDIDSDTEINVPFQHNKPFNEIVTSLNRLASLQTVTAQAHFMLDEEGLDIKFIFNLIRPLQFFDNPAIQVDHSRHITTIHPKCYFRDDDPSTATNLRFSKGNSVFTHQVISTEQPYGHWSCDSLGRLHQQQRVTYKVGTPELNQWMQLSGIVSEFGDFSVVIDTPETVGQLLMNPSEFVGKRLRIQPLTQINDPEHYIYAGAGGALYLARKMGSSSDNINVLQPTLIRLFNHNPELTTYKETFYEGAFYKYISSVKNDNVTTSSFIEVGNPAQVVTLTSDVTPLSKLDLTEALQNLNIPGQPTFYELRDILQEIHKIFWLNSHVITMDITDLSLDTQQLVSQNFYTMLGKLSGNAFILFNDYGQRKFKTFGSDSYSPPTQNILLGLLCLDETDRFADVEQVHFNLNDKEFVSELGIFEHITIDIINLYMEHNPIDDETISKIVDFLSNPLVKYNQIVIHADNNQEFMTSRHLRKLGLLLVELKMGIRPGLSAEQNDQRIPSLQCKEFTWNVDKALVPDDVQNKDAYLANRIQMLDQKYLTKISYNNVRESYPKAHAAFVDMLVKLSQEDPSKLSHLDLNGSKFKDATQINQVITAISKFSSLQTFSWISDGAYQVNNPGWLTYSDFLFSTNQDVVTELLQLVQALSKIPTLRQLGLNMCHLGWDTLPTDEIHHHDGKTTRYRKLRAWVTNLGLAAETRQTTDHRDLVVALLKGMPATTLTLMLFYSSMSVHTDIGTIKWLRETLTHVCRDCCPDFPADQTRSVTLKYPAY